MTAAARAVATLADRFTAAELGGLDDRIDEAARTVAAVLDADSARVMLTDAAGNLRTGGPSDAWARALGYRSEASVPLWIDGRRAGRIKAFTGAAEGWSPAKREVLMLLAPVVAACLRAALAADRRARLVDQLRARVDPRVPGGGR